MYFQEGVREVRNGLIWLGIGTGSRAVVNAVMNLLVT